jgi:hypothetical protein
MVALVKFLEDILRGKLTFSLFEVLK